MNTEQISAVLIDVKYAIYFKVYFCLHFKAFLSFLEKAFQIFKKCERNQEKLRLNVLISLYP